MPDDVKPRRFPPPWTAEETDACYIVKDDTGPALAPYCVASVAGERRFAGRLMCAQRWCAAPSGTVPKIEAACFVRTAHS
jgi:hypothetical protein